MSRIHKWLRSLWKVVLGSVIWDAIKYGALMLIPIIEAIWRKAKSLPPEYIFIGGQMVFASAVTWAARHYSGKRAKPGPIPAKPQLPLRVEAWPVEDWTFRSPNTIEPGNTHQIAFVDFLNDPQSSGRGIVSRLLAKITYYDADGKAYLTVDRGLWKDGSCAAYLGIADSKRLVLAIVDSKGNGFAVDHKVGSNPYAEHYEEAYSPFQVALRSGAGRVFVRLSYSYEPEHWFGAIPTPQGQALWFKLTVGKPLQLEPTPARPCSNISD